MDKNIAAILREDATTISVNFINDNGLLGTRPYTYVTHLPVEVGNFVVVPTGSSELWKIAEVTAVHTELDIEPNSDTKYKWVVDVIDSNSARENTQRNQQIEKMLAKSYRMNARQAYAHQFLTGADPQVLELVKGKA